MRKLKINGVEIEVSDDCTIEVEGNKITILASPQPYIPYNPGSLGGLPYYPPIQPYTPLYPWTCTGNTLQYTQYGNY